MPNVGCKSPRFTILSVSLFVTAVWSLTFSPSTGMVDAQYIPVRSIPFVPLAQLATDETNSTEKPIKLPAEYLIGYGPLGLSLVWSSSSSIPIHIGASRPEFRLSNTLFGFPREFNNQLHMKLSQSEKEILITEGLKLQTWKSGRRLDAGESTTGATAAFKAAAATTTYNSKPPVTPTINVNPAARGNYTTQRLSYNGPSLNLRTYTDPIEVLAEVYRPLRINRKSPLILFLHGRHAYCYSGGPNGTTEARYWPCIDGFIPVPSHQGYRYVTEILASQGYVVVSISANSINSQDDGRLDSGSGARSQLIRHHLALWARWNSVGGDPWNNTFVGRLNMNKVVLVGHSRGGEGVHRAAIDASISDPYKIVGLVSYGPTATGRQVTPDVHSVTILPACDGDVFDLQGQAYVDYSRDIAYSTALRSAVTIVGANHNYFNTEWTPGLSKAPSNDDWFDSLDPTCGSDVDGSTRLTPKEQQVVGAVYTAALIRLAVYQDQSMLPLLDGSFVRSNAIGRAEVAVSAVGGAGSRLLYRAGDTSLFLLNGMRGGPCNAFFFQLDSSTPICAADLKTDSNPFVSPHFSPYFGSLDSFGPPPKALELRWSSRNGATAQFDLPRGTGNLTSYDWIDVRVANDPNRPPARMDLVLRDSRGRNDTLRVSLTEIDGWPGTGSLDRVQARTLRGTLLSTRVDLSRITSIQLVTRIATGRVWVLDVAVSQSRIVSPKVLNLPVVSVETIFVMEGNGKGEAVMKVQVRPTPIAPGEIWLYNSTSGELRQINITKGASAVLFRNRISWYGDTVYDPFPRFNDSALYVVSRKGVLIGDFVGEQLVVEDDPIPILSAVTNNVSVEEGGFLRWTLKLSELAVETYFYFGVVEPTSGSELTSDDVDKSWLADRIGFVPSSPRFLSSLSIYIPVRFEYGATSVDIVVPIVADKIAEPSKSILLELFSAIGPNQPSIILKGTVNAHS